MGKKHFITCIKSFKKKLMSLAFLKSIYPKKVKLNLFVTKIFTQTKKGEKTQTETYVEKCLLFWHKHGKQSRHLTNRTIV